MEYKEFTKRYFDGSLSTAEEQTLREGLMSATDEELTSDELSAKALLRYASLQSEDSARVNMHDSRERRHSRLGDAILSLGTLGTLNFTRIAMGAALGVLAIGFMIHLSRPTVYGYHNGEPITSYAEAQVLAQEIFDNLSHEGFAEEHDIDNLSNLFTLD